ncbi:MAG: ABC transporter permease [Pseudonocardiaceae bacterium]
MVAAAATLLALPPAILVGRAGASGVLGFLGIQAASLTAPMWTYLVILAAGLGLPPLMALVPLVKTSRTTVRAAIDHHGLGSRPSAATGVLARLSRLRRLDRGLLMALRNTIRRPARFLLCVGLLASAGTVFVAGMSLSSGTEAIAEEQKEQRTWDVDVQLASPAPVDEVTTMLAAPTLLEGRWLDPGETGAVVLNQITRNNTVPDVHAGDTVQLFVAGLPTTWRVAGIIEERQGGGGVYATAEGFAAAMGQPQRVNQLRIATSSHDEQTRQAVADAVDKTLTGAGIEVESSASVSRSDAISEGHLGPIIMILLAVAIAMGVIGGIGLASTMSANILDRTLEFGVMHAIGARPKTVRRIVVAEGVLLAFTSCLVAVIPALALTAVLGAGLGNLFFSAPLPFRVSMLAAGIWIALVILGGMLATGTAATRASHITVREALTYL